MKHATPWIIGLLLSAGAHAAPPDGTGAKKLYCWDEGGHRVCGDALPPEAINRARVEINAKSGMRSGEVPRTLTADEQVAASVVARQAAVDADLAAAQVRRDLAMAESYATEADLRRAYGERITLVDESLKTSQMSMANLRQSLLSLLRKAAELELQAQPVPKLLSDNIRGQHDDLIRQQVVFLEQREDRAALSSDLDAALTRYRAMKAPKANS